MGKQDRPINIDGVIAKRAHHDGSTLKQAALALGYVTEQDFERWVKPAGMVHPKPA